MSSLSSSVSSGRSGDVAEVRIDDLVLDVESFDIYEGFATAIDVYGKSREGAISNARHIFDLLSKVTSWRIALGFDEKDNPIVERPEQAAGGERGQDGGRA